MSNDYTWRPGGQKVLIQASSLEPLLAFKLFVLPVMGNLGWMENSKPVTDTSMSSREWLGLVLHALTLRDLNGQHFLVAKEFTGGDGALVLAENGLNSAVLVEQTLATHRAHDDLLTAVRERVAAKSSRGANYSENKHLIVLCNIDGQMDGEGLAGVVAEGDYSIVNVIGFVNDERGRYFLCYLFDKDIATGTLHISAIDEQALRSAAGELSLPDSKNSSSSTV